jgi:hypothetical protein
MFPGDDSLPTAVITAKEQDLRPLREESAEALELDEDQASAMDTHLQKAWFCGVRMGHRAVVEANEGEPDAVAAIHGMQDEFQDLMEELAEALNLTLAATILAWDYLGLAWIAGAKFWEIEIAARLVEAQAGGFDDVLRKLQDGD